MGTLLEVKNLNKEYRRGIRDKVSALTDISFSLNHGMCLGLVGESGCGKSTLCRLLAGLEQPSSGQILYQGEPLKNLKRRGEIQMVFQNSLDAVNLHLNAYHIISEPLENFFYMPGAKRREEVRRLLELVGLSGDDMYKYPAQFSGGQLQRVCIARALAARPKLLILDEPLSSLDVSVQAQILNLLLNLKEKLDLTCILVSHDLRAVYYLSDAVIVMYGGRLVEEIDDIVEFRNMSHPYALRLLKSHEFHGSMEHLETGVTVDGKSSCPYVPMCPNAEIICHTSFPEIREIKAGHRVACHIRQLKCTDKGQLCEQVGCPRERLFPCHFDNPFCCMHIFLDKYIW